MIDALTIQQNRQAWLEELRSGNRQQVHGYLSCGIDNGSEVGFCCLGVATELAGLTPDFESSNGHAYYGNVDPQYLTLPVEAQEWLGVNTGDPRLAFDPNDEEHVDYLLDVAGPEFVRDWRDSGQEYLTGALLNDQGVTFKQIADLIEHFGFIAQHDVLQGAESVSLEVPA
jgi:hypothetical protein